MESNTEIRSAAPDRAVKRSGNSYARYGLLAMLFVVTAINFLDRTNLSIALPFIKTEFHLSATEQGLILAAFSWAYAALQIPGGWLVDRVGPRLSFGFAMIGWSLCTVAIVSARGFGSLLGLRLILGAAEAPAFPSNNRLVAAWFPAKERATATGVYTAGEYVGLAFAIPALSWIMVRFGWQAVFVVTGILGLLFAVVWFKRIHDTPTTSSRVSAVELRHIESEERAVAETDPRTQETNWADLRFLLSRKRLWGMYIGNFAGNAVLFFFLTWFPSYLITAKHLSVIKAGFYGSIPYIAALAGVLLGGYFSDSLLRHGVSKTVARKTPIMIGFVGASVIVVANYVDSISLIVALMSVAFFAEGMTALSWTLVADVAPVRLIGLTGGVFNFWTNLGGAITPIVIGYLIDRTGSFAYGLAFISVVALVGLLAYLLLIDRVERLEVPPR